jgi:DNA polymerase sigma
MFTQFKFNKTEITKTHIDITFHSVSSTTTTTTNSIDYANEKISTYPEVALILRVLKRLFYFKNMNSAFNGGLSSFNLFLIVLSYVQYRKLQLKLMCYSKQSTPISNLGALLMECLQFFACFDFRNFKIDVNSQYPYLPIAMNDVYKGKSLVIIDPLSGMNASKSAYQIDEIQRTFYEGMNYLKQMQELYVNSNNVNNYVYGMFT